MISPINSFLFFQKSWHICFHCINGYADISLFQKHMGIWANCTTQSEYLRFILKEIEGASNTLTMNFHKKARQFQIFPQVFLKFPVFLEPFHDHIDLKKRLLSFRFSKEHVCNDLRRIWRKIWAFVSLNPPNGVDGSLRWFYSRNFHLPSGGSFNALLSFHVPFSACVLKHTRFKIFHGRDRQNPVTPQTSKVLLFP